MKPAGTLKPLRLTARSAGELLDLSPDAVRILGKAGTLTPIYPAGEGHGKKVYFATEEVEAYARGGLAGVVAYREKQSKRKTK
jgi:hypothetical protein